MFTIRRLGLILAALMLASLPAVRTYAQETSNRSATEPSASGILSTAGTNQSETASSSIPTESNSPPASAPEAAVKHGFFQALAAYIGSPLACRPALTVLVGLNLDSTSMTSSLIVNGLACSVDYTIGAGFQFEPALDLYWGYYQLTDSGRAVPAEISERDAYAVGFLINLPVTYTFKIGERFDLAAGLGPAVNLRLLLKAAKDVEDSTVSSIANYMWSDGRFFVPSTLFRVTARLTDRLSISLAGSFYWPVYNFWTGDTDSDSTALSFFDQSLIEASAAVKIRLR